MPFNAFHIGDIEIDFPVVLAPLAGYSDLPFRTLCRRFGAPYCTTEMVLDRCVTVAKGKGAAILATDENDHPCAGQLIGNDPEEMAAGATYLREVKGFDVVDLNFACPVNKALKRRRGGSLMNDPALAVRLVEAVVAAVDCPVTLKVRRKFAEADDESNFWTLAEGAQQAGAAAITVHGRSVEKKYSGPADWDFLKRVKAQFADWTVIGSGDVLTPQAAVDMLQQTGVDAAAVARGVIGNPWFFRQVADLLAGREMHRPSLAEQAELMREHFRLSEPLYGKRTANWMRKFGIKYARMHPHPKELRMAFVEVKNAREWNGVIEKYYG